MLSLQIRNLIFIALQPGVAIFLLPYLILWGFGFERWPASFGVRQFVAER